MKIIFNVNYRTQWGESLYVVGNCKELGDGNVEKAVMMTPKEDGLWTLSVKMPDGVVDFCYSYVLKTDNGVIRYEWGKPHEFVGNEGIKTYELFDKWNDQPENKAFFSSAFTEGIFSRKRDKQPQRPEAGSVVMRVFAPVVKSSCNFG